MWRLAASDYDLDWAALKAKGLAQIDAGVGTIDLSEWTKASSAHLAILVFWWQSARARGHSLAFSGLNPTFQQLAALGGVEFIQTGEADAGH